MKLKWWLLYIDPIEALKYLEENPPDCLFLGYKKCPPWMVFIHSEKLQNKRLPR